MNILTVSSSAGEAPDKYNSPDINHSSVTEMPSMVTSNPLDKMDFSSREFRAGVEGLADKLQVRMITYLIIKCHHDYLLSGDETS